MNIEPNHRPTHLYILDRRRAAARWLSTYKILRETRGPVESYELAHQIIPSFKQLVPVELRGRYLLSAYKQRQLPATFYRLEIIEIRIQKGQI